MKSFPFSTSSVNCLLDSKMPPKKNKNKDKNKDKSKKQDSESSTPQSSVPSVDDEDQQLLQGGACGSSYKSKKSKSAVKRKTSESSATQSSVLSVDDDEKKLPEGGACGSSSGHQSRSLEKSTRVAKSTVSVEESPNRSLSPRNASGSSPGKNRLAVPAQGSGTVGPSSSPKKSVFTRLTDRLSPKKRSQSPSTDSKCRCESKTNHKTDCPESNKIEADAKRKSPDRASESKASSGKVSAVISTEKVEGAQSSSSSDPSFKECYNTLLTEKLEMCHLSVPEQAKVTVSPPKSPRKKGILSQIKGKFSPKKRSPNLSPLRCICANRNDHDLECPERGNQDSSRSQTSSSSASPTSKKKQSDASYTSSENSGLSSSKSSSSSGAIPKIPRIKTVSEKSKAKCNPELDRNDLRRRDVAGPRLDGLQIGIDNSEKSWLDVREPYFSDLEDDTTRRRSRSFGTNVRVSRLARQSNIQSDESDGTQSGSAATGSGSSTGLKNTGDDTDADTELGAEAALSDSSVRPKVQKIEQEDGGATTADDEENAELVKLAEETGPVPSVRRCESLSPYPLGECGCGDRYIHVIGCARERRARQRRNWKRCRQSVTDPKSEEPKGGGKKPPPKGGNKKPPPKGGSKKP